MQVTCKVCLADFGVPLLESNTVLNSERRRFDTEWPAKRKTDDESKGI